MRRVQRRMQVNRASTAWTVISSACARSRRRSSALFRDLLINVTNFFRDIDAFKVLERAGDPQAVRQPRRRRHVIRVWVPGCATGEEVVLASP